MASYSSLINDARIMATWFMHAGGPIYKSAGETLLRCADAVEELSKACTNCEDSSGQGVHPITVEPSESVSSPCTEEDDGMLPEGVMMGEPFNDLS